MTIQLDVTKNKIEHFIVSSNWLLISSLLLTPHQDLFLTLISLVSVVGPIEWNSTDSIIDLSVDSSDREPPK